MNEGSENQDEHPHGLLGGLIYAFARKGLRTMRFGVLDTGVVDKTVVARLHGLGHEVMIGTHNPEETMSRTESDRYGNQPLAKWGWLAHREAVRSPSLATYIEVLREDGIEIEPLDERLAAPDSDLLEDVLNPPTYRRSELRHSTLSSIEQAKRRSFSPFCSVTWGHRWRQRQP